jgi:hypothetical protein
MRRSITTVSMRCAVVQRKAYDGYGAINASARMAAQEHKAESTRK